MDGYEKGWSRVCNILPEELQPLVKNIYETITSRPCDLKALKNGLEHLLEYLASKDGRTDENCKAIDQFFSIPDYWDRRWDDLPKKYREILDDIGGCLHDTVSAPRIAENFQSTPEQLLERIHKIGL
jgi:hypothetical protein